VVTKARPTISTTPSPGIEAGGTVYDTATLAGLYGDGSYGHIYFRLYDNSTCTDLVGASFRPLNGGSSATSRGFPLSVPGTYYWTAVFTGDPDNRLAVSPCRAEYVRVVPHKGPPGNQPPG
jgi:hypothetical protein